MSRPTDGETREDATRMRDRVTSPIDHAPGRESCPRVRARWKPGSPSSKPRCASAVIRHPAETVANGPVLPRLEFKALRLIPWGWGEGWQLAPVAVASPLDGRVAPRLQVLAPGHRQPVGLADPLPDRSRRHLGRRPEALRIARRGRATVSARDQESVRFGDRHVFAPMALPHSTRLGPVLEGAEQPLETQLRPPGRRDRDLVAQLHLHAELEAGRARYGRLRPGRKPGPARAGPARHLPRRDGTRSPIGLLEPQAAQELLQWQEKRRSLAGQKVNVHQLYRKAEGIEEHLQKVSVPAVKPMEPWGRAGDQYLPDRSDLR